MNALPVRLLTVDDLFALPDEGPRYELIEGVFSVAAAPTWDHQGVCIRLSALFLAASMATGMGRVRASPISVVFSDHDAVEPDLVFIRNERIGDLIVNGVIRGAPDIVVEVLSPSNWRHDLVTKKNLYARFGVPEYWVFDPAKRTISQFALSGNGYEQLVPGPDGVYRSRVMPELVIDPAFCFAEVLGSANG